MTKTTVARFFGFTVVLAVIMAFEYGEAFNFYFVGDDFSFISVVTEQGWRMVLNPGPYYHYYPLGILINALPACFGVLEPKWFTLINFLFFLSSSILIMIVYHKAAGSSLGGFAAALLYITAIPNSESIYWKTGTQTIAMAFFSLLSLILLIRHLEGGSRRALGGTAGAYAASMLCIEQGIVTIGILILWDMVFHSGPRFRAEPTGRRVVFRAFLKRHAILMTAPLCLTALKAALGYELSPSPLGTRHWSAVSIQLSQTITNLFDFNNIIVPFQAQSTWLPVASVGFLLFYLAYAFLQKSGPALFFLLASVGSISAISIASGGIELRYFCLPLAFSACLLALFLSDAAKLISWPFQKALNRFRHNAGSPWVSGIIYMAACTLIAAIGFRENLVRREYWQAASTIEKNIVEFVEVLYESLEENPESNQKLYLLDIPDAIWSHRYSTFHIGTNSFMADLRHRIGDGAARVELIANQPVFPIVIRGENALCRVLGREKIMEPEDIERLIEDGHRVFRFSPRLMTLEPVRPSVERSARIPSRTNPSHAHSGIPSLRDG